MNLILPKKISFSERSVAFLYLPSTERNYVVIGGADESDTTYDNDDHHGNHEESSTTRSSSISSSSSSSTTRRGAKHEATIAADPDPGTKRSSSNNHAHHFTLAPAPPRTTKDHRHHQTKKDDTGEDDRDRDSDHPRNDKNDDNDDLVDSSSENTSKQIKEIEMSNPNRPRDDQDQEQDQDQCIPMNVDFCVNVTRAARQNVMDELTMLQLATVVDSQCYPFAAHFLCTWGIDCRKEEGDGERPVELCRDYCEEFMTNCGHKLSSNLKEKIRCGGGEWKGLNSCVTKPGCVNDLYKAGEKKRICDGVMDCIDFSDELHCSYVS